MTDKIHSTNTTEAAAARILAYLERRRKARGIDYEDIHAFDVSLNDGSYLRASDLEAVASPAAPQIVVKSLPWSVDAVSGSLMATALGSSYLISESRLHDRFKLSTPDDADYFPTVEAAKDAAQAHFEKRVGKYVALSQPEPETDPLQAPNAFDEDEFNRLLQVYVKAAIAQDEWDRIAPVGMTKKQAEKEARLHRATEKAGDTLFAFVSASAPPWAKSNPAASIGVPTRDKSTND